MNAAPGQRVEIDWQGGDKGFTFAGAHFRNATVVQSHATDQLDIVMAQTDGALAGLAHGGKGLGQQVIQGLPRGQTAAEFSGFSGQGFVT